MIHGFFRFFSASTASSESPDKVLNKTFSNLKSFGEISEELKDNWRTIDLSHNLIELDNSSDLLRKQNNLETILLNFNRNFTSSGHWNQQIFSNGNLKYFECTGCGFEDLESEYFTGFVSLLQLHLDENRIERVNEKAFHANRNLSLLNLSRNKIEIIPAELFKNLTNFETLLLSENPIKVPENSPLVKSDSIKLIRLDNCKLTVIYLETFSQLDSLETLNLTQNRISTLPDSFAANKNLKSLSLEDNQMRAFSISILQTSNLTELCLDKNNFRMKQTEFSSLVALYNDRTLRGANCQNDTSLFFKNTNFGIPKLFMGSYITLVIICQAFAFVLLTLYYIKISKYERLESDVNYANTILNDDEVYKAFKFNDE